MKVPRVDRDKCIGDGSCAELCPEMFELDAEGKAHVMNEEGDCDLELVVESCPVKAISLVEKEPA